jgi:ABC-type sugar transport system ATPase subunit
VKTLLSLSGIAKSFAGVHALKGVSFDLREGEVHALVGENGAGKSTLIKVVTGAHAPDAGTIEIEGRAVTANSPVLSRKLGVAAIYQQPALFPELTVAENIALGTEEGGLWRRVRWGDRGRRARELLDRIGAAIDPEAPVSSLAMPEQQMVEIAKALGRSARILIMDEPTASLPEHEVRNLFRVVRELRGQGVGIVYISHRLDELYELADRVTVLRDGNSVATRPMKEVDRPELIRLMVGREITAVFPKREVPAGDVLLELRGLGCRESGVRDVSLQVRAGEILGLAGLVGAGRTELLRALAGLDPVVSGQVKLGVYAGHATPGERWAQGMALVSENRKEEGLALGLSVADNLTMSKMPAVVRPGQRRRQAGTWIQRLGVRCQGPEQPVGELSGGNQQKVAIARLLHHGVDVLLLDEPTRGIDVASKAQIYQLIDDLVSERQQPKAVIMVSSYLPELLGVCDRIAVMCRGRLGPARPAAEWSEQALVHEAALGSEAA